MKIFIENLDTDTFFATDYVNAKGEMIRIRIPPTMEAEVVNIDPYFLNQDKNLRNAVFRDGRLAVRFEPEEDDLLPLTSYGYDGGSLLGGFLGFNFTGAGVSVAPNSGDSQILDVTISGGGGGGSGKVLQTRSAELNGDAATTAVDPLYSTLLSVPITTTGGALITRTSFTANADKNNVQSVYRLSLDGTPQRGASMLVSKSLRQTGAIVLVRPVSAAAHTVTLEWAQRAAGSTLSIAGASDPTREHAFVEVQEVTVP